MHWVREALARSSRKWAGRLAARVARDAFASSHPSHYHVSARMRADEPERWVIGVFYYFGVKPSGLTFVAVDKRTRLVGKIVDDEPYRPKVRRV